MDSGTTLCCCIGLIFFLCYGITISSQENTDVLVKDRFEDNDARTRHTRNASATVDDDRSRTNVSKVPVVIKPVPVWLPDLTSGKWYGWQHYMARKIYKANPHKKPTLCYNNVTRTDRNRTALNLFICPMQGEGDLYIHCCGKAGEEHCCKKDEYDKSHTPEQKVDDFDLATGLGIAAVFVGCVSACMFLYCCCCQRRPEIHDGIKLIWVRRSFGKELNRLEQPTYPNHLAVVSGSRNPSRAGSRQGSRNASVCPSPCVSRRGSAAEPYVHISPKRQSHKKKTTGQDIPSPVTITVTTPSDEHGPTDPLLTTTEQKVKA